MKRFRELVTKCAVSLASLALCFGAITATSTCSYWLHQPKEPEGLKEFLKK